MGSRLEVLLLLFFSGQAALIYEVLWAKYLALFLGGTAAAQTVVLTVFMGGLALGSAFLGPVADRVRHPLRLFAWLELGMAVLGALSPLLLGPLSLSVPSWSMTALAAVWLLFLTILMGGTFPACCRFAAPKYGDVGKALSELYFVNSLGAVLGAVLAGFLLVPTLGFDLTLLIAAMCNLSIGLAALILSGREIGGAPAEIQPRRSENMGANSLPQGIVTAASLLTGFVALVYETAWIRLLSLVLGSSVYSFPLMLAAFIAGIAAGGLAVSRIRLDRWNSALLLGFCELGAGLAVLGTLPLYQGLPYWFALLDRLIPRTSGAFYLHSAVKFSFCFGLILLPCIFLGMALPLAGKAAAENLRSVGTAVGRVFGWNTLGCLLGAASAGLFLMPSLGLETLFEAAAAANLVLGAAILCAAYRCSISRSMAFCLLCGLASAAFVSATSPWDMRLLAGGLSHRQLHLEPSFGVWKANRSDSLLYHKDDPDASITVLERKDGPLVLKINGKTDASTGADMSTQVLLAHIPLLLRPESRDVLLVGLGSGVTAGSVLRHAVERLDVVEISPAVIEAAPLFKAHNWNALDDRRLQLHQEDAAMNLRRVERSYDLVISEPSNPWIAGMGNLFSVEFYREARARLKPGGLMAQWCHLYEMDDDTLRLVLRTFGSVFEEVTVWTTPGGDIILVGGDRPPRIDLNALENSFDQVSVREDLRRVGISRPSTLLSLQAVSESLFPSLGGRGRLNERRYPILEYEAAKAFFLMSRSDLVAAQDERLRPDKGGRLLLSKYVRGRGRPLNREELGERALFHRFLGPNLFETALHEWQRRFPEDSDAVLTSARYHKRQRARLVAMKE